MNLYVYTTTFIVDQEIIFFFEPISVYMVSRKIPKFFRLGSPDPDPDTFAPSHVIYYYFDFSGN